MGGWGLGVPCWRPRRLRSACVLALPRRFASVCGHPHGVCGDVGVGGGGFARGVLVWVDRGAFGACPWEGSGVVSGSD